MTHSMKSDFDRAGGGALVRVGSWSNGKREGKNYIMNKKGNEECGKEYEKKSI